MAGSDSYKVIIEVKANNKRFSLDFSPKCGDESSFSLKGYSDVDEFAEAIVATKDVDVLKSMLLEAIDMKLMLENQIDDVDSNEALINKLEKIDKIDSWCFNKEEILDTYKKFKAKLAKISSMEQLERITLRESFTAWDNCAPDIVSEYLGAISVCPDEDGPVEFQLRPNVVITENDLNSLFTATLCGISFVADLETKIDFSDNSVIKEANIHIIDCDKSFDEGNFYAVYEDFDEDEDF
jgi:hypothetical protein